MEIRAGVGCNLEVREEGDGISHVDVNLWDEHFRQQTGMCKGPEAGVCLDV